MDMEQQEEELIDDAKLHVVDAEERIPTPVTPILVEEVNEQNADARNHDDVTEDVERDKEDTLETEASGITQETDDDVKSSVPLQPDADERDDNTEVEQGGNDAAETAIATSACQSEDTSVRHQESPVIEPMLDVGQRSATSAGSHRSARVYPAQAQPHAEKMEDTVMDVGHAEEHKYHDDMESNEDKGLGCCDYILWGLSILVIALTFPVSVFLTIKMVQEYERAVIFRLGRLLGSGAKGPGIFFVVPCIDSYTKIDLRTVSFDVPPQEILTRDSVTVAVDAVVYYRISNATVSVINVEDANRSTRLLAQTTLRNVLGTKTLAEILSDRDQISYMMQTSLDLATDPWGVKVERVEVKDVRLPVQLQRAMAAEAEATRESRAKVIAAEGEYNASRAMKEAADVIAQSPAALQLRYLQTLSAISAEKNSTIIFPLPIEILSHFVK